MSESKLEKSNFKIKEDFTYFRTDDIQKLALVNYTMIMKFFDIDEMKEERD